MATKPLSLGSTQGLSGLKSFEVEKQSDENGSNLHPREVPGLAKGGGSLGLAGAELILCSWRLFHLPEDPLTSQSPDLAFGSKIHSSHS